MVIDDLPSTSSLSSRNPGIAVLEAIGYGPDSEIEVQNFDILAADTHTGMVSPMRANQSGLPVRSCERWIRIRVSKSITSISGVRFWISNYTPAAGWKLNYGVTNIYQKPRTGPSSYAVDEVPTTDPGRDDPNVAGLPITDVSPWIVLQAVCAGGTGPLQTDPFDYIFAWTEL